MSYCITFTEGELKGRSFDLRAQSVLIGRSHKCRIIIPETVNTKAVSRQHVCLNVQGDKVQLQNLDNERTTVEANGIVLDSLKPREGVMLEPGYVVRLASTTAFVLEQGDSKTAAAGNGDIHNGDMPTGKNELADDYYAGMPTGRTSAPTGHTSMSFWNKGVPTSRTSRPTEHTIAPDGVSRGSTFGARVTVKDESQATNRTEMPPKSSVMHGYSSSAEDPLAVQSKTRLIKTGILTQKEIDELIDMSNRAHQWKIRKRMGLVLGAFLAVAGIYYYMQPKPEKVLTWPRDLQENPVVEQVSLNTPFGDKAISLLVPGGLGFRSSVATNGEVYVQARIGALRDVPLWVKFSYEQNADFAKKFRDVLFAEQVKKLTAEGSWNFQAFKPLSFEGEDNGFPYLERQYLRLVGSGNDAEQRYGHMVFAVCGDCAITITREIPAAEQWRGAVLLANQPMFCVDADFLMRRWEGRPDYRNDSMESMLDDADGLLSTKTPMSWSEVEFLLQSVLIKSVALKEPEKDEWQRKALERLVRLRKLEKLEFNRLRGVWQQCAHMDDKEGCQKVLREGEKVFSSSDDGRSHFFRRGAWGGRNGR